MTIGASSMAFIDGSVVPIALSAIQRDLSADFATLQWIVNIYTLFLGALVLVGGAYGDRLGRRRVFLAGTILFVAASVACGLAPNAIALVAARAAQGVGAALMVPQSLALIAATFPEETRGRAIGTWAGASALTTALGPPLGGFLMDTLSWRAVFLVNLPIGLVVLWLSRGVPESRAANAGPADLLGGLLATGGLGALTIALVYLPDRTITDPLVWGGFLVFAVAAPAFIAWEARTAAPMMPLRLFRDRIFSGVNLLTLLLYGALGGALFVVPYTLTGLRGYTGAEAGLALLPLALAIGLLTRFFGSIGDRVGTRLPMAIGAMVVAVSIGWLGATEAAGSYWTGLFGPILGIGIGMSIAIAPLTTTVMNAVDQTESGAASGINNAAARIAGLLAVALTGALMVGVFSSELLSLPLTPGVDPGVLSSIAERADRLLQAADGMPGADASRSAVEQAFSAAFRAAMVLNALLAIAAAILAISLPHKPAARVT
ncbi:DHA2 family efflux MFS transporter permease subunit [Chthonobacter albigriseus]|uniref:DHA2 family efflux MFS transporter permease subunit n=1 Tax=Chthonobacter albigriseus TaxID=1683161 RepID=UPI0015EF2A67